MLATMREPSQSGIGSNARRERPRACGSGPAPVPPGPAGAASTRPGHRAPGAARRPAAYSGIVSIGGRSSVRRRDARREAAAGSRSNWVSDRPDQVAAREPQLGGAVDRRRPSGPAPGRPGGGAADADVDLGERVQADQCAGRRRACRARRRSRRGRAAAPAASGGPRTRRRAAGRSRPAAASAGSAAGAATSSVTRPPPAGTPAAAGPSGRSYIALTSCTPGSVSSGPTMPETKSAEKSRRSASTKATMSPLVASSERQSTSPLPGRAGRRGSTSSRWTTRAPAAAATSRGAVGGAGVEHDQFVDQRARARSSARGGSPRRSSPTVASSFSAGSTTLTVRPPALPRFAASSGSSGRSAADQERPRSQCSTSSSTSSSPCCDAPGPSGRALRGRPVILISRFGRLSPPSGPSVTVLNNACGHRMSGSPRRTNARRHTGAIPLIQRGRGNGPLKPRQPSSRSRHAHRCVTWRGSRLGKVPIPSRGEDPSRGR